MGAKPGQRQEVGSRSGLALLVFGWLFVVLFAGFAIAQGIGAPSVPSGDVAIVQSVPDEIGPVSEAEFKRAMIQQAAPGQTEKSPEPGRRQIRRTEDGGDGRTARLDLDPGAGRRTGHRDDPETDRNRTRQIKKQNFKTGKGLQRIPGDLEIHPGGRREAGQAPGPEHPDPESDHRTGAASLDLRNRRLLRRRQGDQYTTAASRDVRVIANKDEKKAEAAKALLERTTLPPAGRKSRPNTRSTPRPKPKAACSRAHRRTAERKRRAGVGRLRQQHRRGRRPGQVRKNLLRRRGRESQPVQSPETGGSQHPDQKPADRTAGPGSLRRLRRRIPEQVGRRGPSAPTAS